DLLPGKVYPDAEIGQCITFQPVERVEYHLPISLRVDRNDDAAAPPEQFVNAKIFDVPAVAQIQRFAPFAQQPEELAQKIIVCERIADATKIGHEMAPACATAPDPQEIWQPIAETDI